jgi:hypothetical protein
MPGQAARKAAMRGSTHLAANAVLVVSVTVSPAERSRSACTPASSVSKPSRSAWNKRSPAGVSASCRVSLRNSGWPSALSSPRTWWLMAVGVTESSAAAR